MTVQDLLKKDFKIFLIFPLLGLILTIIFGKNEFMFGMVGMGMGISVVYKLKHIFGLVEGDVIEECMKGFLKYLYIPVQIFMSFALLGSLIYYSIF